MKNLSKFSDILQDLMTEHELDGAKLSQSANIAQSNISMYLKGNTLPSFKNLIKLTGYFNCSADYLLGKSEKAEKYPPSENVASFIERLDTLINEQKITVYHLAKGADFPKTLYYDWKKGNKPAAEQLIKLADYFYVPVDYLLGLTDKK